MPSETPKRPGQKPSETPVYIRQLGLLGVIGGIMASYVGAGVGVGYLLWKKAGFPYMTLVITGMAGLVLAMYRIYQIAKKESGE